MWFLIYIAAGVAATLIMIVAAESNDIDEG